MAPVVLGHAMAAAGIDDDFFVLWPPLVLGALSIGDLDLAERLIAPVATSLPGRRPPAVAAQWHRLRGLLAAARDDDPQTVEAAMRAGVDALAAFGAVGFHAQAQEELGRWLVTQGRADEAQVPAHDRPCDVRRHRRRRLARQARRVPDRPRAIAHRLLDAPTGDGTLIVGRSSRAWRPREVPLGQQVDCTSLMSVLTLVLNADHAVAAAARVSAEAFSAAAWTLAFRASNVVVTAST